ncbi:hypothetical protein [Ciceribacter lividus]|nr:hypothetical protein [Ciceribacter lividus]
MVGWGRRPSGLQAVIAAKKSGSPFLLLEDGFLRSIDRNSSSLSFAFDSQGIYYDATAPSTLEELIRQGLSEEERKRATDIIARWRLLRLSKYNADPEFEGVLPDRYVLVVDQVANDCSVEFGLANSKSFGEMLEAALRDNPSSTILVKVHPDTLDGVKTGYFDLASLKADPKIRIIADRCHAARLIAQAEKVYTVTSQMGFEALIWGKPLRCFGMPFYAGWGLTQDVLPAPVRRGPASLEQLIFAALVRYPRYVDPANGLARCEVETVMEYIGLQRLAAREQHKTSGVVVEDDSANVSRNISRPRALANGVSLWLKEVGLLRR